VEPSGGPNHRSTSHQKDRRQQSSSAFRLGESKNGANR
jgi:hypothetical protein